VSAPKTCGYCFRSLSLIQRFSRVNFCSSLHEDLYLERQATLSINRILSLTSQERDNALFLAGYEWHLLSELTSVRARTEGVPRQILSPLRQATLHPVDSGGTRMQEPQPLDFVPSCPAYPCFPADMRPESSQLAADQGLIPEVSKKEYCPWPQNRAGKSLQQEDSVLHGRVVAAEMRAGFCLGPAGLIQILTAVVVVRDEVVKDGDFMTQNPAADGTIDLASLLETVGRSIMTVNADAVPGVAAVAVSAPKVARRKAPSNTRRASGRVGQSLRRSGTHLADD